MQQSLVEKKGEMKQDDRTMVRLLEYHDTLVTLTDVY